MAAGPHARAEAGTPQRARRTSSPHPGWKLVYATAAGLMLSCAGGATAAEVPADCDNINGMPILQNVLWDDVWTALDEQASCTQNCHTGSAPSAELDLSSRMFSIYFLVGQPSSQDPDVLRVDPGNPKQSLLLQKVNCNRPSVGERMPLGDAHIPVELQGLIYDWIAQGAFGEPAEDPIERTFVFADSWESIRCRANPSGIDRRCPVDNDFRGGGKK